MLCFDKAAPALMNERNEDFARAGRCTVSAPVGSPCYPYILWRWQIMISGAFLEGTAPFQSRGPAKRDGVSALGTEPEHERFSSRPRVVVWSKLFKITCGCSAAWGLVNRIEWNGVYDIVRAVLPARSENCLASYLQLNRH